MRGSSASGGCTASPPGKTPYSTELRELARTQHDILREVHPDVGEIKEHVVEEQGAKINEISEQVTQVADAVASPEASAAA